jgi:crossover junction endodeoxyribonuclease RuvC
MTATLLAAEPPTATTDNPHVIGLDTSLKATGIASSRGWCELVGYKPRHKNDALTKQPHPERLQSILGVLSDILLAVGQPDLVVLESPSLASMGGGGHERGWLWWEVYRSLTARSVPIALLAPSQRMLYATGKGRADKAQIIDAVARRWPEWTTNGNDNLADAVVLMAAGRDWLNKPLTVMPKAHRAAFDKAVWPEMAVAS